MLTIAEEAYRFSAGRRICPFFAAAEKAVRWNPATSGEFISRPAAYCCSSSRVALDRKSLAKRANAGRCKSWLPIRKKRRFPFFAAAHLLPDAMAAIRKFP
jgi:hypothetical protein